MVYSVSNGFAETPGMRVAGRLVTDTLGYITQGDTEVGAGNAVQFPGSAWGCASNIQLDPVNTCLFWGTNEYLPGPSGSNVWQTRIVSFAYPNCLVSSTQSPPLAPPPRAAPERTNFFGQRGKAQERVRLCW